MRRSMLQVLPTIRANVSRVTGFAGGENARLDAVHPLAPPRFRRQMIELSIEQPIVRAALASTSPRSLDHRSQPVDTKRRPAG